MLLSLSSPPHHPRRSLSAILLSVFTYRAVSSKKNSIITRFTFFFVLAKKIDYFDYRFAV